VSFVVAVELHVCMVVDHSDAAEVDCVWCFPSAKCTKVVVVVAVAAAAVDGGGGGVDDVDGSVGVVAGSAVPILSVAAAELVFPGKSAGHDLHCVVVLVNVVTSCRSFVHHILATVAVVNGDYSGLCWHWYYCTVVMDQLMTTFFDLGIVACTFDSVVMQRAHCMAVTIVVIAVVI